MPSITLALSLQRSRSVPRPAVLDVQFLHSSPGAVDRAGDVPDFDRWVQTYQYCNPIPGSPFWVLALVTRSLLSCGRRYPQNVLGRRCLWLLGLSVAASNLRVALRLFLHSSPQTGVISRIPKLGRTRPSPIVASQSSRNHRLINDPLVC